MGRSERVAEAIKQEVSNILQEKIKDPRLGFVTIVHVEVTDDLRTAKIFFSVLGKKEEHQKTQQALESSLGYIRKLVAQRVNLKFAPELLFREDHSSEYSTRIEQILNEIKEPDTKDGGVAQSGKEGPDEPKKSNRSNKKAQ